MSKTIDERVVSMQFDNKQFETNVRTSMSTLEKLKRSLNLSGAAKGLDNVNAAAKSCNLSPLGNAVETVKLKFSALEVIAVTALANITNSAVNAGKRIISALTIDPIKTGFNEYETKLNSIQTIMSNTASKGTTREDVTRVIDELNTYADKTIYNFQEMTRNIGTFTAAGVGLEESVAAIQGIANLAAASGSSPQQASTAMYQLSQALATGTVKLMDWNSVVNAGMGGEKFQEALKATAREHGIAVDAIIKRNGSFRDSLQEGWLTADILNETLRKFTVEGAKEYAQAMLASGKYTQEQADALIREAQDMEDAATKVKTFTQLWGTLKEAAQSGWGQTWEIIVGDFEEAKELWTGVSDTLGGIIGRSAEARNTLLEGAMTSNWDKMVKKINEAGISSERFEEALRSTLEGLGYNVDAWIEKYGSLENAFRSGAISSNILRKAIMSLEGSLVDLSGVETGLKKGNRGEDVKKVQQALKDLGYDLGKWDVDGIIGSKTEEAIKKFQEEHGLEITGTIDEATLKALEEASGKVEGLFGSVSELISGITELGGRELLIESFKNVWEALGKVITPIKEAFREIFPPMTAENLTNIITKIRDFTKNLIISDESAEKIKRTFKGLFAILDVVKTFIGGGFSLAFKLISAVLGAFDLNILDVTASIGDALVKFRDWILDGDRLKAIFAKICRVLANFKHNIKEGIEILSENPKVQAALTKIKSAFTNTFGGVIDKIKEFKDLIKNFGKWVTLDDGTLKKIGFKEIGEFFKNEVLGSFKEINFKDFFNNIVEALKGFGDGAKKCLEDAGVNFDTLKDKIIGFFDTIGKKIGENKGAIIAFGSLLIIILIINKIKKAVSRIAGFLDSFSGIGKSISDFIDSFTAINSAKAKKIKTEAIYNIAKSIALLAGALFIISKIKDPWKAVGVMGALAAGLLAFMALTQLISKINKDGSSIDMGLFGSMMRNLGIALILMAAAVKILGGMDRNKLIQGGIAVGAFLGMMAALMIFTKFIGVNDIAQFGKMMRKLSTSLLFLAAAVYIFGSMKTETLVKGGIAIITFLTIFGIMMTLTSGISEHSNAFGKMIRNISISLLLLAGVVAIFGHMDTDVLIKGGLAVAAFLLIMIMAMQSTKSISKEAASFGRMMLSIGASLLLMAWAIKIIGKMDMGTLMKGGIFVAGFLAIVVGLMKATSMLGRHSYNAGKMGLLLLSFSASILLITGSIALLSMIDGPKLVKALAAVAGIGLILSGILVITKFAKNINTKTIIALSASIAIMAGSIIALTFVDPIDLRNATLALGAIVGMFSLLAFTSKFLKMGSVISLTGLMLVVTGVAYLMVMLANSVENADEAIKAAKAIAILIGVLSVACLALSAASKFGPKSFKGLLVLAGMMGIISLFAGITIWQLPNIGKQLSAFMEEMKPFIAIANTIKPGIGKQLAYLGQAMLAFTAAGALYSAFNIRGGMAEAFAKFGGFITEILPIIKDMALELSGEGIHINTRNLNAVIGAVGSLAEAASKGPSWKATAGGFGGKGIGGGFLSISVPMLTEFTEWMKAVITPMKELAMAVSGEDIDINGDAIASICEGVKILSEAASNAPSINIIAGGGGGGGGGKGFGGGFLAISIPQLSAFKTWMEGATDVMSTFAGNIKDSAITSEDAAALISVCEGVKVLAEAAKEAPGVEAGIGFAKFAGGGGVFLGGTVPLLDMFKGWIEKVIPIMSDFAGDIKESKIKSEDTKALVSICEGVKVLGEAAKEAPGIEAGIGFAKFAGGGGVFLGGTVPLLDMFKAWIVKVIPIMSDFAGDIKESKIKSEDADKLKSICEGVKVLGEAAKEAPGIEAGIGFAKFAGGGGVFLGGTVPLLDMFKAWIEKVIPIMSDFAGDIKESKIKSEDTDKLKSICEGVTALGEAAKSGAGGWKGMVGVAAAGPVFAAFVGIEVDNLTEFKNWIAKVAPVMTNFATDIKGASITEDDAKIVGSICEAVGILADAADTGKTSTEITNAISLLGAYTSTTTSDLESFRDFLTGGEDGEGISSIMDDIITNVGTDEFEAKDFENIRQLCQAIKTLGEAASFIPSKKETEGWFSDSEEATDFEGFSEWVDIVITTLHDIGTKLADSGEEIDTGKLLALSNSAKLLSEGIGVFAEGLYLDYYEPEKFKSAIMGIALAMQDFGDEFSQVDTNVLSSAAGAAKNLADTLLVINNFGSDYSSIDTISFQSKSSELASAIKTFNTNMEGVDPSTAVTNLLTIVSAITGLAGQNFDGANELAKAIKTLGTSIVRDLVDALSNSDKLTSAGASIIANLVAGITESASTLKDALNQLCINAYATTAAMSALFMSAGTLMMTRLASGITGESNTVNTASSAVAKRAANAANGYKYYFWQVGGNMVKGFAEGISANTFRAEAKSRTMALKALNAAKTALDINSPSKETYKVGAFFGKGFINAIEDYESKSSKAGYSMADSARQGLSNAISKVGTLVENGIDSQPTIRPVLDLSDVESGAGTINGMFSMTPSIRTLSNVGTISSMMNRSQNGANSDVISAIENLGKQIGRTSGDTYQINGVTYDDGSNITDAVRTIIRAARVERRR